MAKSELEWIFAKQLEQEGIEFEREHAFAKSIKRKWRFDFAFPDVWVAVEVHGGTFSGGRHVRGAGFREDMHKHAAATIMGWQVLYGDASMVRQGDLLEYLLDTLSGRAAPRLRRPRGHKTYCLEPGARIQRVKESITSRPG